MCVYICIYIGWGTNEKAIIKVLGHRNATQRKQIREAYEQLYQEDLLKRLESELSGDFEVLNLILILLQSLICFCLSSSLKEEKKKVRLHQRT